MLTTVTSTFAATIETKELLTAKIGKKDASKLSANFLYRLPTVVRCPEELLSCPDSQFSAVCDAVSTFANSIMSLDRPKGIDEKKHIQPLSQMMLESIAKILLHRLHTDIVPEVHFEVLIQTLDETSLVSGRMDKALRFNSIDRFLLSYEDKNFTTEGISKSGIAKAATQLIFLGRGLMEAFHIAYPRLVGFICDGLTFMILEYGFEGEKETVCRSHPLQLISDNSGELAVNVEAIVEVAKLLVHGFLIAESLGKVLEKKKIKLRAIDEEDDDEKKEESTFDTNDENADDDSDLPDRDDLNLGSGTAKATQPYNLRKRMYQPFLDDAALLRHTLFSQY
jgi:hypothetical protein